ncbi:conserved hypothetical protein [Candidatus Sulfopaludibacter sp. SbA3]|nr:conserved hypothetical protein [Candidatus Sulfopaludibacter sp. SbA3]
MMKQKVFSLGDKFAIQDENGAEAFFVDGRVFSVGHQLSFEDAQGNELLFIKQKVLSWGPTYEIYKGEEHVATIKKELFTFFHCTFDIHLDEQGDLAAEGNFSDHEYVVTRDGAAVAQISKQWFTWADTYGVEIGEAEDPVLMLACTVVIDMCCHGDR